MGFETKSQHFQPIMTSGHNVMAMEWTEDGVFAAQTEEIWCKKGEMTQKLLEKWNQKHL